MRTGHETVVHTAVGTKKSTVTRDPFPWGISLMRWAAKVGGKSQKVRVTGNGYTTIFGHRQQTTQGGILKRGGETREASVELGRHLVREPTTSQGMGQVVGTRACETSRLGPGVGADAFLGKWIQRERVEKNRPTQPRKSVMKEHEVRTPKKFVSLCG